MKKNKCVPFSFRHNILVYMFWDVPKYKGCELDRPWDRVKYILQLVLLLGGIVFANEMSSDAYPSPEYKNLKTTEGQLLEVTLKDVRGRNVSLI